MARGIVGSRSSGGPKDATDVWKIVWVEEHASGTYTKSTKVYSEWSVESKVGQLKSALKKDADPNDPKWRWRTPVLEYHVYHCPLTWTEVTDKV